MLWILAGYISIRLGTVLALVIMSATALPLFVIALTMAVSVFSAAVVVRTFSGRMTHRYMQYAYTANIFTVLTNLLYVKIFYPANIESYEYFVVGTLLEVVVFVGLLLVTRLEKYFVQEQMVTQN